MKFVLLLSLFGAAHLNAAALALNVLNPDRTASPAQQLEFTGTILNQTPVALTGTDLFVNIFAYDPSVLSFEQTLGLAPVTIGPGALSPLLSLSADYHRPERRTRPRLSLQRPFGGRKWRR